MVLFISIDNTMASSNDKMMSPVAKSVRNAPFSTSVIGGNNRVRRLHNFRATEEKSCPTHPVSSCMELEFNFGMVQGDCQCNERYGEGIFECKTGSGEVWCKGQISKSQAFLIGSKTKGGASLSRTVPSPPTPSIEEDFLSESVSEKTIEGRIYSMGVGNILLTVVAMAILGVAIIASIGRFRRMERQSIHQHTTALEWDNHNTDDDSLEGDESQRENVENRHVSGTADKVVEMATLA